LQDWDIDPKVVPYHEAGPDRFAEVEYQLRKGRAILRVVRLDHLEPEARQQNDVELHVVHELLHLYIASFASPKEGTPEEVALELAIHRISEALVALKRRAG
jgi:hypothetical protein